MTSTLEWEQYGWEKEPEHGKRIIASILCGDKVYARLGYYHKNKGFLNYGNRDLTYVGERLTHWAYLPELPTDLDKLAKKKTDKEEEAFRKSFTEYSELADKYVKALRDIKPEPFKNSPYSAGYDSIDWSKQMETPIWPNEIANCPSCGHKPKGYQTDKGYVWECFYTGVGGCPKLPKVIGPDERASLELWNKLELNND